MNYQQRAKELLNGRSLIFHASQGQIQQNDPALWSSLVETAVEFGGTHVQVGYFPYKYGTQFLPDNVDPYAAWCNCTFGLLWAFPPEVLREWITPADYEW